MFQEAIKALTDFRNKHLGIAARYIIIPSKAVYEGKRANLASSSSKLQSSEKEAELTGTGGTTLIPFLKQARDETLMTGAAVLVA